MKNLPYFLGLLASLLMAHLTASGTLQKLIHFNSVEGEMGFCFICFMMASCFLIALLPERKTSKK